MNVIELKDIVKSYAMGDTTVYALNHLTVSFEKGKFTSIVGPSGSGKSTLMNVLGCLDRPTSGEYILEGKNIARYTDDELAHTRNARIGFVFQSFNLLSRLSAVDNVALPLIYAGVDLKERTERAEKALTEVGLGARLYHKPNEMSGGQRQRVAIARALINDPAIIMADEPTGNLDPKNAWEIMGLLEEINMRGTTVIVVTHNKEIVEKMQKRVITLSNGVIVSDEQKGGYYEG